MTPARCWPVVFDDDPKLGLSAAQSTIFSYPTRSEYLKRLGDAYNRSRMTPSVAKLFARWLKFTQPKG